MQKENQNQLAVNLLSEITAVNPERFQDMKTFFSDAFILQTSFPLFNEEEYREQWAFYIEILGNLANVFEDCKGDFAKIKLHQAIDALQGKELHHD